MDPRLAAEIGLELGEGHRVGLEGVDVAELAANPIDKRADSVAVERAAVDIYLVVRKLEETFRRVKIVVGQDGLQESRIECAAESDHRFEHLARTVVGQTIVQRLDLGPMHDEVVEQPLVEHMRTENIRREHLERRERHNRGEAQSAHALHHAQYAMRGDDHRRRFLQIGESLHRRDRQPGNNALPLALIVIDHGHDLDAAVLADARQPLAFRRGANDRQPVQIGDIESAMRRHSVAQAWQTAGAVEAGQPMRIGARC